MCDHFFESALSLIFLLFIVFRRVAMTLFITGANFLCYAPDIA